MCSWLTRRRRGAGIAGARGGFSKVCRGMPGGCGQRRLAVPLVETDSSQPWPWRPSLTSETGKFSLQAGKFRLQTGKFAFLPADLPRFSFRQRQLLAPCPPAALGGGLSPADAAGDDSGGANAHQTCSNSPVAVPKRHRFYRLLKHPSFLSPACRFVRLPAIPCVSCPGFPCRDSSLAAARVASAATRRRD